MHYSCFGPDLDPAILAPLHPSNKRATPLLVFLSLPIFIISPRVSFVLSFAVVRSLSLSLSTSLSSLIFIISSHRVLFLSLSPARHLYLASSSYYLLLVFVFFFLREEGLSFPLLFLLSSLIFIILPHRPCSFEHRVSQYSRFFFVALFPFFLIFLLDFRYGIHYYSTLPDRVRFFFYFLISYHEISTLDDDMCAIVRATRFTIVINCSTFYSATRIRASLLIIRDFLLASR